MQTPPRNLQAGFTLVEVLVTIIVLAIGVLGLAGLQLASMRSNHSAFLRTQATLAANDLIDRMRINPADYAGKTLNTKAKSGVAGFDHWAASVAAMLPAPNAGELGKVDCSGNNGCPVGHCEVIISWDDSRGEIYQERGAPMAVTARDAVALQFQVCTRLPTRL